MACLLFGACEEDDSPSVNDGGALDGGASDASMDAHTLPPDGGPKDASTPTCSLDQKYQLHYVDPVPGAYAEAYVIEGSTIRSRGQREDGQSYTCMAPIPCSGGIPSRPDLRELQAALDATSAAFTTEGALLGRDAPDDFNDVLVIERADGKKLIAGAACSGAVDCSPVPAEVQALRVVIGRTLGSYRDPNFFDGGIGKTCP